MEGVIWITQLLPILTRMGDAKLKYQKADHKNQLPFLTTSLFSVYFLTNF